MPNRPIQFIVNPLVVVSLGWFLFLFLSLKRPLMGVEVLVESAAKKLGILLVKLEGFLY
jgi:hypothetical protein